MREARMLSLQLWWYLRTDSRFVMLHRPARPSHRRCHVAGYYSYKWAEVLSADAFEAFEDAGLDDEAAVRSTGLRFRDTVLSLGGGKEPLKVFTAFRGREPSTDALLRHNGLLVAA